MTKVVVVSAGLRNPSSTKLLADRIADAVATREEALEIRRIEAREHAHAVTDALLSGFATGALREALDEVQTADALVLVTPTFQATMSGLFLSFMDLVEEGTLRGTPVLMAATGGSERHSLMIDTAMRPLVAYLGGVGVPTGIYAATSDFAGTDLDHRIDRAAGELTTMLGAGSVRRPKTDEFTDITPFEQLLGR